MSEQTKKKKFSTGKIIELALLGAMILAFVVLLIIEAAAPESAVGTWAKKVCDLKALGNNIVNHTSTFVWYLILIVVIYAVCRIIRTVLATQSKKSTRKKTVITLFDGLIKYGCAWR